MSLFLFLFSISLMWCRKSLAKNGEFGKWRGDGHNRGKLFKEGGFKPSAHHDIEELKVGTLGALNYWGGGGGA